jgi:hypothetical protein
LIISGFEVNCWIQVPTNKVRKEEELEFHLDLIVELWLVILS